MNKLSIASLTPVQKLINQISKTESRLELLKTKLNEENLKGHNGPVGPIGPVGISTETNLDHILFKNEDTKGSSVVFEFEPNQQESKKEPIKRKQRSRSTKSKSEVTLIEKTEPVEKQPVKRTRSNTKNKIVNLV